MLTYLGEHDIPKDGADLSHLVQQSAQIYLTMRHCYHQSHRKSPMRRMHSCVTSPNLRICHGHPAGSDTNTECSRLG
eukprot:scaffold31956_cov17-Prasinocladus_malaysianus.AAC.1